jgi:hypothetical protein
MIMTEEIIYINDPLGRQICINKKLCSRKLKEIAPLDLYDDLYTVLAKPAILIEIRKTPPEFAYFRSIGWHFAVLIKVKFAAHLWQAYTCVINPSDDELVELLKIGKQII